MCRPVPWSPPDTGRSPSRRGCIVGGGVLPPTLGRPTQRAPVGRTTRGLPGRLPSLSWSQCRVGGRRRSVALPWDALGRSWGSARFGCVPVGLARVVAVNSQFGAAHAPAQLGRPKALRLGPTGPQQRLGGLIDHEVPRRTRATLCGMAEAITQRELRNDSGEIMRRLDQGEAFVVTRNGVPVGELIPLRRRRFVARETVAAAFAHAPTIDAARFRDDLDRHLDQGIEPHV